MAQARKLVLGVAVAALTFGVTGVTQSPTPTPFEEDSSLSNSDIIQVLNETAPAAPAAASQAEETDEDAAESAKMGEEEGTQTGEQQAETPDSQAAKMTGDDADGSDADPDAPQKN